MPLTTHPPGHPIYISSSTLQKNSAHFDTYLNTTFIYIRPPERFYNPSFSVYVHLVGVDAPTKCT